MKIELTPDAAQWVQVNFASGRFVTVEDAVRYAMNRAKRAELRDMLDATEAEGGSDSTADTCVNISTVLPLSQRRPDLSTSPHLTSPTLDHVDGGAMVVVAVAVAIIIAVTGTVEVPAAAPTIAMAEYRR